MRSLLFHLELNAVEVGGVEPAVLRRRMLVELLGRDRQPCERLGGRRGLAFVQQHCTACHGVTANSRSPNPESPPFEDVANRPELTVVTLRQFLSDSHNYPAAMNFTVDRARIRDIAAYMLTLRKPHYRPQP